MPAALRKRANYLHNMRMRGKLLQDHIPMVMNATQESETSSVETHETLTFRGAASYSASRLPYMDAKNRCWAAAQSRPSSDPFMYLKRCTHVTMFMRLHHIKTQTVWCAVNKRIMQAVRNGLTLFAKRYASCMRDPGIRDWKCETRSWTSELNGFNNGLGLQPQTDESSIPRDPLLINLHPQNSETERAIRRLHNPNADEDDLVFYSDRLGWERRTKLMSMPCRSGQQEHRAHDGIDNR